MKKWNKSVGWLLYLFKSILITSDEKFYAFVSGKSLTAQLQQCPVIVIEAMIAKDQNINENECLIDMSFYPCLYCWQT